MKNIFKKAVLASAVLGALTTTSCNDFLTLEPQDKEVLSTYFSTPEALRNETLTLYSAKVWSNFFMNYNWKFDMLNGDMYYTYSEEGQWYFGTYTEGNSYIREGWKGLYNVISFCNSIINDTPGACGGSITQDDITKAVAEARCIRSLAYYYLTEAFHDAPIISNNSENIASGNLNTPRNPQKDIYRFALEDADFAVENLPETDSQVFRATKKTAHAIRAKLLITMAAHTDYGYDRAALYSRAAADAKYVIDNSGDLTKNSYEELFTIAANNGPESILAIQCGVLGWSFGNQRPTAFTRDGGNLLADYSCWGGGKGPCISLQKMYEPNDVRAKWTFMAPGDYYPNLNKENGGYTYQLIVADDAGTEIQGRIGTNAHLKKYVIGKSSDNDGQIGANQDAAINFYLIRLADVYLTYTEAIMGTATSTSDAQALAAYNTVRTRAGVPSATSVTYKELLKERRREFAIESINWYDILRLRYREGDQVALDFLNSGYETGYNRVALYVPNDWNEYNSMDVAQKNDVNNYKIAQSQADGCDADPIYFTASSFIVPLPSSATTSTPALLGDIVPYYSDGGSESEGE